MAEPPPFPSELPPFPEPEDQGGSDLPPFPEPEEALPASGSELPPFPEPDNLPPIRYAENNEPEDHTSWASIAEPEPPELSFSLENDEKWVQPTTVSAGGLGVKRMKHFVVMKNGEAPVADGGEESGSESDDELTADCLAEGVRATWASGQKARKPKKRRLPDEQPPICQWYLKGECWDGDKCPKRHEGPVQKKMAAKDSAQTGAEDNSWNSSSWGSFSQVESQSRSEVSSQPAARSPAVASSSAQPKSSTPKPQANSTPAPKDEPKAPDEPYDSEKVKGQLQKENKALKTRLEIAQLKAENAELKYNELEKKYGQLDKKLSQLVDMRNAKSGFGGFGGMPGGSLGFGNLPGGPLSFDNLPGGPLGFGR